MPLSTAGELVGEVSRRSVRELIAEKIAQLVSSGVLSEGDALPGERELAASLSVSRETIRGAIGILADAGVLRVSHGARTMVASRDVGGLIGDAAITVSNRSYDLDSVHEARLLVEQRLARMAATRVTEELLAGFDSSISAQVACGGDAIRFLLCDREFHALLYKAAGNDALFDIAMSLYNYMLDHRRRIVSRPGSIARSIEDHRAILEALRLRDPDAAASAVVTHSTRIYETTQEFLEEESKARA